MKFKKKKKKNKVSKKKETRGYSVIIGREKEPKWQSRNFQLPFFFFNLLLYKEQNFSQKFLDKETLFNYAPFYGRSSYTLLPLPNLPLNSPQLWLPVPECPLGRKGKTTSVVRGVVVPSLLRSFLACECMETTSFLSTATIMKSLKPSVMKLDGLSKKTALPIGRCLSNSLTLPFFNSYFKLVVLDWLVQLMFFFFNSYFWKLC